MRAKIVTDSDGLFIGIRFKCPGCGRSHVTACRQVPAGSQASPHQSGRPCWDWNGQLEAVTLSPSVLVRTGHYCNPGEKIGNCACDFQDRFPDEKPWNWPCIRCHSFVRDGRIQFLSDCTHKLAGQTVDLPEVE